MLQLAENLQEHPLVGPGRKETQARHGPDSIASFVAKQKHPGEAERTRGGEEGPSRRTSLLRGYAWWRLVEHG